MLGGDPAACSHRVEQLTALRGLEGQCWAGIQQLALIGMSSSLHSEAWLARGGDPAAASHGVGKFTSR